jgi:hypothetical protein
MPFFQANVFDVISLVRSNTSKSLKESGPRVSLLTRMYQTYSSVISNLVYLFISIIKLKFASNLYILKFCLNKEENNDNLMEIFWFMIMIEVFIYQNIKLYDKELRLNRYDSVKLFETEDLSKNDKTYFKK